MASVFCPLEASGRLMVAPPGMPAESRAIRDGYVKMLKDPEFIAEVKTAI
jgi:hypothetical protein